MTIASEVQRIKTNIANAYTSCNNKGATMPASRVSDNLASTINSISSGITPTGTLSITANGTYDVTNYASADVSVSGGGGDIAIPHIKIIRATSWEVTTNDFNIDLDNIVTDNEENLPYLMFSPEDIEDVNSDWMLSGGFFLSAPRSAYAAFERFCPGISIGSFSSSTWYGLTFTCYSSTSLHDEEGSIIYWFGSSTAGTIEIYVTWNAS